MPTEDSVVLNYENPEDNCKPYLKGVTINGHFFNLFGVEKRKLTKKNLKSFISWTTSRYNNYLGYGTKAQNICRIFDSFIQGCDVGYNGKEKIITEFFKVECASPVGENYHYTSGGGTSRPKYWKTKSAGDTYYVLVKELVIVAFYRKEIIIFK